MTHLFSTAYGTYLFNDENDCLMLFCHRCGEWVFDGLEDEECPGRPEPCHACYAANRLV